MEPDVTEKSDSRVHDTDSSGSRFSSVGLEVDVTSDVMTVTIDRPATRNSQTPEMWNAFAEVCADIPTDVRFVVVRSVGDVFSSGLDRGVMDGSGSGVSLGSLAASDSDARREFIAAAQAGFACWRSIAPTTIALVQGPAIGAGWQLALSCDLVLATSAASFAMRETRLGLVPDLGASGRLVRALGYHRTFEICASGREVSAREAAEWGLVSMLADDLDSSLAHVVTGLRTISAGAIADLKRLLVSVEEGEPSWIAEQDAQLRRLDELLGNASGRSS